MKRLVIVGGVAAGASAAAKARRTSEDIEIVMVEAGPYVSFANCGLPYYLGGEISERDSLFVSNAETFIRRFNIDVRLNTRAESVDLEQKKVQLVAPDGQSESLEYDRLILATGAEAVMPAIKGIQSAEGIFTLKTVPDVDDITDRIGSLGKGAELKALVIGGGYIGLETAEQLNTRGCDVTLVELADQVIPVMDREMTLTATRALVDSGVKLILGEAVIEFRRDDSGVQRAITSGGSEVEFDLCILSVGVRPSVQLAKDAGLAMGDSGAIQVDGYQKTSDSAVYAAGDNSETIHAVLGRPVCIPLAGPANKAGRAAGLNAAYDLMGRSDDDPGRLRLTGVLGTSIVRVSGVSAAVTGLTERQARREGFDCKVTYMAGPDHASYYPGSEPMHLKVVWEKESGRLLGAQCCGGKGVDKRIDIIATAIQGGMGISDLEQLDLCYAPPFGSAKDVAIQAGFAANNSRKGVMPEITAGELFEFLESDDPPVVVDVRSPREYEEGHLAEAVNVPLSQIRERRNEIPTSGRVALYCLGGYRSYVALRILMNHGWDNICNVQGGYEMINMVRGTVEEGDAPEHTCLTPFDAAGNA